MLKRSRFQVLVGLVALSMLVSLLVGCSDQEVSAAVAADLANQLNLAQLAQPLDRAQEGEFEVEGVVTALTATSITINGQTFTYDPAVVVHNSFDLKVGEKAHLQTRLVNGIVTVTKIVPQGLEDREPTSTSTPTPSGTVTPTVTITPTVTATPRPTEEDDQDQNDDNHGGNHDQENGEHEGGVTPTAVPATPRPTVTPRPTMMPKPTATVDDHGHNQGHDDQGNDDQEQYDNKPTATARPATPTAVARPATATPRPTATPHNDDDKNDDHPKTTPGGSGDDHGGGKGKGGKNK